MLTKAPIHLLLSSILIPIILCADPHSPNDDFFIAPGDTIRIILSCPGIESDISEVVSDNGYIALSIVQPLQRALSTSTPKGETSPPPPSIFLKSLHVEGLTIPELESLVATTAKNFFQNVETSVLVYSPRYRITVTGYGSKTFAVLPYIPGNTVWEYISESQGLNEYGMTREVYIIKRNGERILLTGDSLHTYIPGWGETIYIPRQYVFTWGAVVRRGPKPFIEGAPAMYYIGLAGGKSHAWANLNRAYLIKHDTMEKIPLSKNPTVEPNDQIVVPYPKFTWRDFTYLAYILTSITISWLKYLQ